MVKTLQYLSHFFRLSALSLLMFLPQAVSADEFWAASNPDSAETIDHQLWQQVLDDHLIIEHSGGVNLVDYEGLAEDKNTLERYINQLTGLDPRNFTRNEQMAYWINLYNAQTVLLIANSYPIDSIMEIGEASPGNGPWNDPVVTVAERTLTLNDIEHVILRPIWKDARIHFAVNCASIGCPDLQANAFTADNLDASLDKAAIDYLNHPRAVFFVADEQLRLSSIFEWYASDFGESQQEVLASLSSYLPEGPLKGKLRHFSGEVSYAYDWDLNGEE